MTEAEVQSAVDEILAMLPRILKVTYRTIWSFGLHAGVNSVMLDTPNNQHFIRHIMEGYRSDAALMTVTRLFALLDSNKGNDVVSYQAIYRRLKEPEVAEALVGRNLSIPDPIFPERQEKAARDAIAGFLAAYQDIDWKGAFRRLHHFRNFGVAHLLTGEVSKSITYDELETMVRLIARMAEEISFFSQDILSPREYEIEQTKQDARKIWEAAYRGIVPKEGLT